MKELVKNRRGKIVIKILFGIIIFLLFQYCAFASTDISKPDTSTEYFKSFIESGENIILIYILAFGLGFLASLTPCILPMIPIILAIFGTSERKSRLQNFLLSFVYVQGVATLYTVLGLTASLGGATFGAHHSNIWVNIFLVVIFFYLALIFGGYLRFRIPRFVQKIQEKHSKKGFVSAYFLGLISGVLCASCSAPAYFIILDQIRLKSEANLLDAIIFGISLSYIFALGIGVLFIIVAVFGINLPKSGNWQVVIKNGGTLILFTVSLYYLSNIFGFLKTKSIIKFLGITGDNFHIGFSYALPPGLFFLAIIGFVFIILAWLFSPASQINSAEKIISKITKIKFRTRTILYYILGTFSFYFISSAIAGVVPLEQAQIKWFNHPENAFQKVCKNTGKDNLVSLLITLNKSEKAKKHQAIEKFFQEKQIGKLSKECRDFIVQIPKKPIMLDFFADWCRECKILEKQVFRSPDVAQYLNNFHLIKVDVTEDTPEDELIQKQYGVLILPTIKFINSKGIYVKKHYFAGSGISKIKFLQVLKEIK
jgi:thiol:disulfide interchange protein DsbD